MSHAASAAGVAHCRSARWRASAAVRSASARGTMSRSPASSSRCREPARSAGSNATRRASDDTSPKRGRDERLEVLLVLGRGAAGDLGEHVPRLAAVGRAELVERGEEVVVAGLDAVAEALHRPGAQDLVVEDVVAERVAERPLAGGARSGLREQRDHVHADAAGRAAADHRLRVHGARQVVVQVAALGHVVEEGVALHLVAAVALQVLGRSELGGGSRRGEQREQEKRGREEAHGRSIAEPEGRKSRGEQAMAVTVVLSEVQRATLAQVCDTFVPSVEVDEDPGGLLGPDRLGSRHPRRGRAHAGRHGARGAARRAAGAARRARRPGLRRGAAGGARADPPRLHGQRARRARRPGEPARAHAPAVLRAARPRPGATRTGRRSATPVPCRPRRRASRRRSGSR